MLQGLPAGNSVFVDANIFYLHFVFLPEAESLCRQATHFLNRIESGDLSGVTSVAVLAEACHKVMLAEAKKRFELDLAGLVRTLQKKPSLIMQLTDSACVVDNVRAIGVRVEPVSIEALTDGQKVAREFGLLTNDATIVAMMRHMGLSDLATNDADFDVVPGITVWKPR